MNVMTAVTILSLLAVGGCATQPQYRLTKNVSEQELQQDNAACQNQAQMIQVADWEFKGTFMEGANIQMKRNRAFENCLVSRGYARTSNQDLAASKTFVQELDSMTTSRKALCDKSEYKPLFEKTICEGNGMTVEMLSDKSKITKKQKQLFSQYKAEYEAIWTLQMDLVQRSGGKVDKDYVSYVQSTIAPATLINISELYEGKKNWGQYNKEAMRIYGLRTEKFNERNKK